MQKIRQDVGLGRNIRALRIAAHMTQSEVVTKMQLAGCDVSRSVYSQMEGGTYNIRVRELTVLKDIFGVDYNALFAGLDQPPVLPEQD